MLLFQIVSIQLKIQTNKEINICLDFKDKDQLKVLSIVRIVRKILVKIESIKIKFRHIRIKEDWKVCFPLRIGWLIWKSFQLRRLIGNDRLVWEYLKTELKIYSWVNQINWTKSTLIQSYSICSHRGMVQT